MKLDATRLALATALVAAFLYALCWGLVALAPEAAMRITVDMLHMDAARLPWHLDLESFLVGTLGWGLTAGLAAWLVAGVYNRLGTHGPSSSAAPSSH